MCEIRPMTGADLASCSSLSIATRKESWESMEKPFYPIERLEEELMAYSPESLANFVGSPNSFSFVALVDNRICGCVLVKADTNYGVADIGWLFVAKAMRGRGIAGMLIDSASRKAADLGCHKIIAFTMKALPDANAMYQRYGFVMEGYFPRHWMKIDFVQYGKQL